MVVKAVLIEMDGKVCSVTTFRTLVVASGMVGFI